MSIRIFNHLPKIMSKDILTPQFSHYLKTKQLKKDLYVGLTLDTSNLYQKYYNPSKKNLICKMQPLNPIKIDYSDLGRLDNFSENLYKCMKENQPEEIHCIIDLGVLLDMEVADLIQSSYILGRTGKIKTLEISGYAFHQDPSLVRTIIKKCIKN